MKSFGLILAMAWAASAAVDGVVTNQTTGKPQGGVVVTLVELGTAMNNIGSVTTSADGKFTFPATLKAGAPHLIQAQHQGVNYNRMLPPGTPGAGLSVDVFNASASVPDAQVSQDMFLLEPTGTEVIISERIVYNNTSKLTYLDPDGSIKIYVPKGVTGPVQVRIQAPQGMPITRPAEKGKSENLYVVRYPIKPGETNVDVGYSMPMSNNQAKFEGKILHSGGPIRFVAPSGVKLEGPFEDVGPIPGTTATAYTLKGSEYAITVSGTGSLRASAQNGGEGEGETGPPIEARKPLIYERLPWVLSLAFAMLGVGFAMLWRRTAPVRPGGKR
jgi:hypothetical protein